jgi:hypothetical protein
MNTVDSQKKPGVSIIEINLESPIIHSSRNLNRQSIQNSAGQANTPRRSRAERMKSA